MTSQSQPCGTPESVATEAQPSAALKPSEVLAKAADLIEPEGAWTQETLARDALGNSTEGGLPPDAVCFCLEGACRFASSDRVAWTTLLPFIYRATAAHAPWAWNDDPDRTQPEVVAALRKAAELARSEGQ